MKSNYKPLGDFIEEINIKNKDLKEDNLLGVSISKKFIPSIANTHGTNFKNYKVIKYNQFAYGPVTSRNGDKISIALLKEKSGIISSSYKVFKIIDEKILCPDYLMLWFEREEFDRYARFKSHGSVREIFSWEELSNTLIPVPDIEIQQKIVKIDKVIRNRIRIKEELNNNLEKIVLSIFSDWFVYFEPFKNSSFVNSDFGSIPKDWKIGTIGDYCKLKSGFAFKSAWWQEEGTKVIKIKDINQGNIDLTDCSCVSEDKLDKASEFKVFCGDLLIAMTGATLGKFSIVPKYDEPLYVNQRVGKFFLGKNPIEKLPFLWSLLNQRRIFDEIINRGQGSAQLNVSPTDIETISIILPSDEVIKQFNEECLYIFQLMINNSYEISQLTNFRDALLPKLMSREIDVTQINCK